MLAPSSIDARAPLPFWFRSALTALTAAAWQGFASTFLFWFFPFSLLATVVVGHALARQFVAVATGQLVLCLLAPAAVFLWLAVSVSPEPIDQLSVRLAAAQLATLAVSAVGSLYWRKANQSLQRTAYGRR